MDQNPAVAVQDRAHVEERPANVYVADIYMPVLVGLRRLLEACALLGWFLIPPAEQPGPLEHAVGRARTHRYHISIQHHEGDASVAIVLMGQVEDDDCPLLPLLQPEVSGDQAVMPVYHAVTPLPAIELAETDAQPPNKPALADPSPLGPAEHEIHHLISSIMRHPAAFQISPQFFLTPRALP